MENRLPTKQKAIELTERAGDIEIYIPTASGTIIDCKVNELPSRYNIKKQIALLVVDEILNNNCGSTTDFGVNAEDDELYIDEYYWQEVKQEINNL